MNHQENKSSSAVGVAAIFVAAVSAVVAGAEIIREVAEAKKANKLAHLEDSIRNIAKNLNIDQK